jgi:predicted TPR repeat methyltransferase
MATTPLFVSSGDLIADRRYQWAIDHARRGEHAEAADILEQTVELAPAFATAWFALGAIRDQLGDRAGAIAAFAQARDCDPDDYHGARLHLARLGAGAATPAMTATYLRRLFDQHAPEFDRALCEGLDYRGPELLGDALAIVCRADERPMRFGTMLDLGCGTGLAGAALRPHVDWLVGVDLSAGMIEAARSKGLYDKLVVEDIGNFLAQEAGQENYHLVIAADVFVYCADLVPLVGAAARVLAPGGLVAFTVEAHDGPGVRLQPTLRYAHGADHVRAALAEAGLSMRLLSETSTRQEKGAPVPGLLAVAQRT